MQRTGPSNDWLLLQHDLLRDAEAACARFYIIRPELNSSWEHVSGSGVVEGCARLFPVLGPGSCGHTPSVEYLVPDGADGRMWLLVVPGNGQPCICVRRSGRTRTARSRTTCSWPTTSVIRKPRGGLGQDLALVRSGGASRAGSVGAADRLDRPLPRSGPATCRETPKLPQKPQIRPNWTTSASRPRRNCQTRARGAGSDHQALGWPRTSPTSQAPRMTMFTAEWR